MSESDDPPALRCWHCGGRLQLCGRWATCKEHCFAWSSSDSRYLRWYWRARVWLGI